jgi:hypothetical protein
MTSLAFLPDECLWFTMLVDDTRNIIMRILDPVSAALLGETCETEWARYKARKDPWTYRCNVRMAQMAARLGYVEIFDYCSKKFGQNYNKFDDCLDYALGGDVSILPWIKKQFIRYSRRGNLMMNIPSMSWSIYTMARVDLDITDKMCYDYMSQNEPEFHDKQVLCDVLKRGASIDFSEKMFKMALTDGTVEVCNYYYERHSDSIQSYLDGEDNIYFLAKAIIDAGNADTFSWLINRASFSVRLFFSSSADWLRLSRIALHNMLCDFRKFPTYASNIIPMAKLLLSLGCLWLDSALGHILRVMDHRRVWDKEQLTQLRDLGMPMILHEGLDDANPYIKWVKESLIPPPQKKINKQ